MISENLVKSRRTAGWQVPPKMTIAAWRTLTAAQRTRLDKIIKKTIQEELSA